MHHCGAFFIKSWLRELDFIWLRLHCTGANQPLVDRHTAVCLLLVVNLLTSLVQILQHTKIKKIHHKGVFYLFNWLRELDLNQRPSGYEPDELPGCSTPR